ncbi:GNAT family N-acetyltransferase [Mesorhizobium sp. CA15]|uniref:GNAT family N-acetyltransferase n=1 Tax=unclassified Mesorhizobium TaxID=325217 RepID=UPI000BAFED7F|nr:MULTISPECIES: GNAT family protein [unclassified Mesorhizobium]MBZ9869198.1 GNAT family N-acetyltransferase [Mesorhizobium sp. CA15]PBB16110.1 GNAT family N-acetyltransferase [Mesorhizobium sp. WSM4313]
MTADLPDLRGARLILRRPIPKDVETRLALGRHREIVEAYGGIFDPNTTFTRGEAEAAIRFIQQQNCAWVIDAGCFIGHVRLHNIDWQDKRAALAIGIDDQAYLGKGYGTEAIRLVLGYAFGRGLHRVSLRVLSRNSRAIACYRKCGFVEEGREREAAFVGGAWQDDIIMGLLDREFDPL